MDDKELFEIEKFLEQRVLGYSKDFTHVYWRHRVQLKGGEECTLYQVTTTMEDGYRTVQEYNRTPYPVPVPTGNH